MRKYSVAFEVLGEIRMGSPYNGANVILTGDYVPDLSQFTFQDKGIISEDGRTCYLVQWDAYNDPGHIIWKISADSQKVVKSKRIEGCCESLRLQGELLRVVSWQWDSNIKRAVHTELDIVFEVI